jgi:hypothetical protein
MKTRSPVESAIGAPNSWVQSLAAAAPKVDAAAWLSVVCILMGWLFFDTLAVNIGPVRHGIRFYDMAAVIVEPAQMFTGIRQTYALLAIPFGVPCFAALSTAVVAPFLWNVRAAWLAYLTPLALILLCGAMLYVRTSGEYLSTSNDTQTIANDLVHLANDLIHRGSEVLAKHVSISGGAYLALIGSAFLGWRGISRFRGGAKP